MVFELVAINKNSEQCTFTKGADQSFIEELVMHEQSRTPAKIILSQSTAYIPIKIQLHHANQKQTAWNSAKSLHHKEQKCIELTVMATQYIE